MSAETNAVAQVERADFFCGASINMTPALAPEKENPKYIQVKESLLEQLLEGNAELARVRCAAARTELRLLEEEAGRIADARKLMIDSDNNKNRCCSCRRASSSSSAYRCCDEEDEEDGEDDLHAHGRTLFDILFLIFLIGIWLFALSGLSKTLAAGGCGGMHSFRLA